MLRMLKTLGQLFKGQQYSRYLRSGVIQKTLLCPRNSDQTKFDLVSVCRLSTRASVIEEETLSYRVLEHIRENPVYSTLPVNLEKLTPAISSTDEKYAIKQILLVIAHNPGIKTSDILHLFHLYASSNQFVLQSLISDRSLMKDVLSKVQQSLHYMNSHELKQLALSLRKLRRQKIGYINSVAKSIATHCEKKAAECNLSESLELFHILLILYGSNVCIKDGFDTFMLLFESNLSFAKPYDLVQILYYIGLAKRKRFSQEFANKAIQRLEPHLHSLTFTDAGIAASGVFKSGVNFDKSSHMVVEIARHLKGRLKETSSLSDLESFALVSMIKFLRTATYQDGELLSNLNEFVMKTDKSYLSLQVVTHLLSFYANIRVYEKNIFSKLEKLTLEHLSQPTYNIRMKDLSRLVWSFSHTGHGCSSQFFSQIDKYLLDFAHGPEVIKSPQLLSDSLLSLAMCGHYHEDLIKKAFSPELIKGLQGYQRSKQLSRLLSLKECLQVEVPKLAVENPPLSQKNLPVRTLSDEVFHRPGLAKLMEGVNFIHGVLGVIVFRLKFLLPSINYANVILDFKQLKMITPNDSTEASCVERNHIIQQLLLVKENSGDQSIAIELLEPQFLIQPVSRPIGIVGLKLRLLRQIGWNIKILSFTEVDQCGDDTRAIAALLIDKITCN